MQTHCHIGIICLLAILIAGVTCACAAGKAAKNKDYFRAEETSKPVPAIDFSLKSGSGDKVSLSDFKGKVVWLCFWATWCHACKVEMKHLDEIRRNLATRGFEVIAINIDSPDRHSLAVSQSRALKLSYPVLFDPDSRVVSLYNSSMDLPFSVLIDRNGNRRFVQRGFSPGEHDTDIEKRVSALLDE